MKKYLPIILIIILAASLRLIALDKFPAGLNADEAAIGYNAYSLIQTGRDEHGAAWPLVFQSFDDYKPPLYIYIVLPFVKVFGLNIWAVRLPSALLGVASVYFIYLLTIELFRPKSSVPQHSSASASESGITFRESPMSGETLGLIAALMLAISPWHLQFSRGGWEVNVSTLFILLGIYAFIRGLTKPKYFLVFVLTFAASLYTYHSARVIAPLLALILLALYRRQLFHLAKDKKIKSLIISIIIGIVISLPLAFQLLSPTGRSRFSGVSVFADSGPLWEALNLRGEHPGFMGRVLHNKYATYSFRFIQNYLSHFSPRFLFINGDEIARSRVPEMGQTYLYLFPFFLAGLFVLFKKNSPGSRLILAWLIISPLAAALTFQSPHALRAQNMTIPMNIIIALGLCESFRWFAKYRKTAAIYVIFITLILAYGFAKYLHEYYVHYPKELPYAWQYGFDQIAQYVKDNGSKYKKILISDRYDQPYILMAFFMKYPPTTLQKENHMTPRDQFGFSTLRTFNIFEFRKINYEEDRKLPDTLIISADEPIAQDRVIYRILDPNGISMYQFISTNGQR